MIVAAIDIGTDKIAGAIAAKTDSGIELLAFDKETCNKGAVLHGNANSLHDINFHIGSVIRKLENQANTALSKCFICHSGQGLLSKQPANDRVMQDCIQHFAQNGITLQRVEELPSSIAAKYLLTDTERYNGCLYIDMGCGTTSVVLYENGKQIYTNTRPSGTAYFFSDLTSLINNDKGLTNFGNDRCQLLISKFATAVPVKEEDKVFVRLNKKNDGEKNYLISNIEVNMVVQARLKTNLKILDALKASWFSVPGRSIAICGGGSRLSRIDEYLTGRTGLPVRRLEPSALFLQNALRENIAHPEFCNLAAALKYANEDCSSDEPLTSRQKKKSHQSSRLIKNIKNSRLIKNILNEALLFNDDNEKFNK